MISRRIKFCCVGLVAASLASCSVDDINLRASNKNITAAHLVGPAKWHANNERRCLRSRRIRENQFIRARKPLGSPSGCGAERPFIVSAANGGSVLFKPAATLRCPMISPVEQWLKNVVQPAGHRHLNARVVGIKVAASYACRRRNNNAKAKLSEHGRANALDISAFYLSDGSTVTVKQGWRRPGGHSSFLRTAHSGACRYFSTVLGPNADAHHADHFHFDLAKHGRDGKYRICQ